MNKYIGKAVEGTLIVLQVWHDEENGEFDIKILEIGENLPVREGCTHMSAGHDYLRSEVKVITKMDGELEHWDAENLLDYLHSCCYTPIAIQEEKKPLDTKGWPYTNEVGNCWCGHTEQDHAILLEEEGRCQSCQCVGYIKDKRVNNNDNLRCS